MLVRLLLQHQGTVNHQIVISDVLSMANLVDGLVIDTVELTVADVDVIDGIGQFLVLIAHNHDTVLRLLAGDILHVDVANDGVETTTADFTRVIVGIDFQYGLATLAHGDVAHVDILDDTAATRVGLDA